MTTTTKAENGKGSKAAATVEADWADAGKVGSEADHPAWCPQWANLKEDALADMMTTVPEGSTAAKVVVGMLQVRQAFGEPRYFIEQSGGGVLALPLHGALTSMLDKLRLEPAPKIRLEFKGAAKRARAGQRAAFLYDLMVKPADAIMPKPRDADAKPFPALLPIHKENKAKRAANSGAEDDSADD